MADLHTSVLAAHFSLNVIGKCSGGGGGNISLRNKRLRTESYYFPHSGRVPIGAIAEKKMMQARVTFGRFIEVCDLK